MFQGIYDSGTKYGAIAEQLGILNANAGGAAPGLSTTNITGMTGLGDGAGSLQKVNNNWEIDQAFSWVREPPRAEIRVRLHVAALRLPLAGRALGISSRSAASIPASDSRIFCSGVPSIPATTSTKFFSLQRFYYSWFVQDNWRVNSRLSVNMGLRNDSITAWKERHNRLAGFVPEGGGNLVPVGTAPFTGDSVQEGARGNWARGSGFAYTITPKTVLRAGGGIFYSFKTVTSGNSLAKNAPFSGTLLTTNDANNFAAAKPISAGFPADRPQLWPIPGSGFYYWPQDAKTSTMYEWNINLQRELRVEPGALGGVCRRQGDVRGRGRIEYQPGGSRARRGGHRAARIRTSAMPRAWCRGATRSTTRCRRRSSGGMGAVRFSGAWTWAHSIDDTSGESSNSPIQNSRNLAAQRASSTFDVRHKLTISGTFEMPFGKGRQWMARRARPVQWIAGGWQINTIGTFQTGLPFTPTMQTNNLNTGTGSQFPNRIASGELPSRQRTHRPLVRRFGVRRARPVHFRELGTKHPVRPGHAADRSLAVQELPFPESRRLEFRAEAFNAFNTPQFNNPNSSIGFSGVARITSAGSPTVYQRTSRQIQLAMKLYF